MYTASLLSPDSKWETLLVPLVVLLFNIEHMVFGGLVVQARKKYGIPYPTMYAIPGALRYYDNAMKPEEDLGFLPHITNEEAYAFNLIQRGHQNTVENAPFFLAILLCAWSFPLYAGIAGFMYIIGRAIYMYGYAQDPQSRMYGALFIYPGLLTLFGLSIWTMTNLWKGVGPY
jgi:glutathione S-transferase